MLQGQGVAKTAIAQAAQGIELGAQAPGASGLAVDRVGHAVAVAGRDGQGEGLPVDMHLVVAEGNHAGQYGLAVQAQLQGFAAFQADATRGVRGEIACQVQARTAVGGHQGRQVPVLLRLLKLQQARVDFGIAVGRVPQPFEDGAQGIRLYMLRATVGIDPIDGQARAAGENFQVRFAQRMSPTGDKQTRALKGGKCAPCGAGVWKIIGWGAG